MQGDREANYYLMIRIFNSSKSAPIFNWSQARGNIALGIQIAKEEVERKINRDRESHYSILIKLRNDKENRTLFEWNAPQGNIRTALDNVDGVLFRSLGFDLTDQIRQARAKT
jgi:hypothetical protein